MQRDLSQAGRASIQEPEADQHGWYGSITTSLGDFIGLAGAVPCCFIYPDPYRSVYQGIVGLVTRFGRFSRAVEPGLVKINPLPERLIQVDVKIQIIEVPRQICITKDNITLSLTSVIYYHIISPRQADFGISDLRGAIMERAQATLRHVVGTRVLQGIIERREELAQSIGEMIECITPNWGIQVESILIKDIVFSSELQESLSMAAQSRRPGESKVIGARVEVDTAKMMRHAADILSSAPAMQIRYLEAMQVMAKTTNSKVIFLPAPNQTIPTRVLDRVDNGWDLPPNLFDGQARGDSSLDVIAERRDEVRRNWI